LFGSIASCAGLTEESESDVLIASACSELVCAYFACVLLELRKRRDGTGRVLNSRWMRRDCFASIVCALR